MCTATVTGDLPCRFTVDVLGEGDGDRSRLLEK